jgi:hypothetical protein
MQMIAATPGLMAGAERIPEGKEGGSRLEGDALEETRLEGWRSVSLINVPQPALMRE